VRNNYERVQQKQSRSMMTMTISDLSKKTLRQAIDTLVAKQGFIIKGNGDGTVRFVRAPLADLGIRYL